MSKKVEITGIDTSKLEKLNKEQSEMLMLRIKNGDKEAKDRFVVANLRLVLSIILRFHGSKVTADDMFQAGCIGLIKAVENFDTSVGVCFSTYADHMIMGEIKRVLRSTNGLRISRSNRDRAYQALKARVELEKDGNEPTIEQIANRLDSTESEVAFALDAISDITSLYDPVYNKAGDTIELLDQLKDEKNTEEDWTEKVAIQNALEKLSERERKIINMRYFEGKTQTEISNEVGLSQAQVSRIEKCALGFIKTKLSYT